MSAWPTQQSLTHATGNVTKLVEGQVDQGCHGDELTLTSIAKERKIVYFPSCTVESTHKAINI